jgi:hypothetical protein
MKTKELNILTLLSVMLAVILAVVSFFGIFVPGTYARETASMAAQGIGQDIFNLFFIVPLFLVSVLVLRRKSVPAFYVFGGIVFYILYSFVIYCFGVHFNSMFLLYCVTLGLATYLFIIFLHVSGNLDVRSWYDDLTPKRTTGIYIIVVSLLFYVLWMKDIIPAIIKNDVPASVSDFNLLVNPVHVIDISFVLPGLIISAVLLMKKSNLGYILGPISLVFIIILAIALAMMVIMMKVKGISEEASVIGIFVFLAFVSLIFLILFFMRIKRWSFADG